MGLFRREPVVRCSRQPPLDVLFIRSVRVLLLLEVAYHVREDKPQHSGDHPERLRCLSVRGRPLMANPDRKHWAELLRLLEQTLLREGTTAGITPGIDLLSVDVRDDRCRPVRLGRRQGSRISL